METAIAAVVPTGPAGRDRDQGRADDDERRPAVIPSSTSTSTLIVIPSPTSALTPIVAPSPTSAATLVPVPTSAVGLDNPVSGSTLPLEPAPASTSTVGTAAGATSRPSGPGLAVTTSGPNGRPSDPTGSLPTPSSSPTSADRLTTDGKSTSGPLASQLGTVVLPPPTKTGSTDTSTHRQSVPPSPAKRIRSGAGIKPALQPVDANLASKTTDGESTEDGGRRESPRKLGRGNSISRARPGPDAGPVQLPLPRTSLPGYLHLELSHSPIRKQSAYPSFPARSELVGESTRVKINRLINFLLLPPHLESVLLFGVLACLDSWLFTFTILPVRFGIAVWLLFKWLVANAWKEMVDIVAYVWTRLSWVRGQKAGQRTVQKTEKPSLSAGSDARDDQDERMSRPASSPTHSLFSRSNSVRTGRRHRRTRSTPSTLLPSHKADILRGLLITATCLFLAQFDASRMYHTIRGQSAIKLYVIFNVLEVGDRLLSAIGQDILACLLSADVLERNPDGRSRVWRPCWMFMLAVIYSSVHAIALFYQAITLNVAVNSYSNALLTLLMSNQFVEIKGTVFKRFDREGLFQITCADIIERFQLWLMMTIIAMRNLVELGPLFSSSMPPFYPAQSVGADGAANVTTPPSSRASITPTSFTLLPEWAGQVVTPMLVVLGSEMVVDWLKHAYITKFSNTRRSLYGRFLDVLAKDYYINSFSGPADDEMGGGRDLIQRLGLPVIPLACLFIRTAIHSCRMLIMTHVPSTPPLPSPATADRIGSVGPTTTATLSHIDYLLRRALGRSSFGTGGVERTVAAAASFGSSLTVSDPTEAWWVKVGMLPHHWLSRLGLWEFVDDAIALSTIGLVAFAFWLLLLATKLVLGIVLLHFSRNRYQTLLIRQRYRQSIDRDGKDRVESDKADRERKQSDIRGRGQKAPNSRVEPRQTIITSSTSDGPTSELDPDGIQSPPVTTSSTTSDRTVRRGGPFGTVQLSEASREVIFEDDKPGLDRALDRHRSNTAGWTVSLAEPAHANVSTENGAVNIAAAVEEDKLVDRLAKVGRYDMVGKRIW